MALVDAYGNVVGATVVPSQGRPTGCHRARRGSVPRHQLGKGHLVTTPGAHWDDYVSSWTAQRESDVHPGDEWGTAERWEQLFRRMIDVSSRLVTAQRLVELGPGSGKYTEKLLQATRADVLLADVSQEFLRACESRFQEGVASGRVRTLLLRLREPGELYAGLREHGWNGNVDAIVSIDAMVHVDLQYLIVYLLTAALVLDLHGEIILTVADATSAGGFEKLLEDIPWTWKHQGTIRSLSKFDWLSPDLVEGVLDRVGFKPLVLETVDDRDLLVVARLTDKGLAERTARAWRT